MTRSLVLLLVVVLLVGFWPTPVCAQAGTIRYNFTVNNTWSPETHPNGYPQGSGPHFSLLGVINHDDQVSFWQPGTLASPAIKQMAETGDLIKLQADAQASLNAGHVNYHFVGPPTAAPSTLAPMLINVSDQHPLLSVVSMLGPTPDWFIGVDDLDLRESGIWRNKVVVDLFVYDGGTRSAEAFALGGPLSHPQEPVHLLDNTLMPGSVSVGSFTFEIFTSFLDGDLDHDGFVGIEDLNLILGNWNQNVPAGNQVRGDITGDGFVGIEDLNVVIGNWNAGALPPAEVLANVPEPGSAMCLLAVFAAAWSRQRARA